MPPAYVLRGRQCLSVHKGVGGGGGIHLHPIRLYLHWFQVLSEGCTPSPYHTFTGPSSLCWQGQDRVLTTTPSRPARTGWGTPWPEQDGVPPPPWPGLDGVPLPGTGYAWTGYAAGGTTLADSRRRTFLF